MDSEVKYLYSVNPKRIIRTLCGVSLNPPIRSPRSLRLSLEEAKECLKYGSVYRRFANEQKNERVLIGNIERLHNEKFMTEEEYSEFLRKEQLKSTDNRGKVVNDTAKDEDVEEQSESGKTEESEVETPVEDNTTESVTEEEKKDTETSKSVFAQQNNNNSKDHSGKNKRHQK